MWIGCDIVKIERLIDGEAIAKRILSDVEYQRYLEYKGKRRVEFLAGRFAAREAIIKALPIDLNVKEIVIEPKQSIDYCGYSIQVSIAHDGDYAIANALVLKKD